MVSCNRLQGGREEGGGSQEEEEQEEVQEGRSGWCCHEFRSFGQRGEHGIVMCAMYSTSCTFCAKGYLHYICKHANRTASISQILFIDAKFTSCNIKCFFQSATPPPIPSYLSPQIPEAGPQVPRQFHQNSSLCSMFVDVMSASISDFF
jgi:hypothetical protein